MLKRTREFMGMVILVFVVPLVHSNDSPVPKDLRGSIVRGNIYKNPELGMTITLPGALALLPGVGHQPVSDSDCHGPVCGNPEIDVTIATTPNSSPAYRILLAGYKLKPPYLDRNRYPLRKLAEVMMTGSLEGSGLVPIGTQSLLQLDGREGYRLLAGRPGENIARAFGYVSESNKYIFLLVGSAADPTVLESAIEAMKLTGANP